MDSLSCGSLTFRSSDRRFGVLIEQNEIRTLLQFAANSGARETGGLLIGHYNSNRDTAIVTEVLGPPTDSKSGRTWFVRGVNGLYSYMRSIWPRGRYYLGEWHFHPGAMPSASGPDLHQMAQISESDGYSCPEPILLIVGGEPRKDWQINAYQFVRDRTHFRLEPEDGPGYRLYEDRGR